MRNRNAESELSRKIKMRRSKQVEKRRNNKISKQKESSDKSCSYMSPFMALLGAPSVRFYHCLNFNFQKIVLPFAHFCTYQHAEAMDTRSNYELYSKIILWRGEERKNKNSEQLGTRTIRYHSRKISRDA